MCDPYVAIISDIYNHLACHILPNGFKKDHFFLLLQSESNNEQYRRQKKLEFSK